MYGTGSVISITEEERVRFAAWLEQSAKSDQEIAEQSEKLGPPGEIIASRCKVRATVFMIVARDLRSIEEDSV